MLARFDPDAGILLSKVYFREDLKREAKRARRGVQGAITSGKVFSPR